jgi:GT2 family glycosyltransferase
MDAVVVSHNEGTNLLRTVHWLLATMPPSGKVIVVDDDSSDGSADVVAQRYPTVRVIRTPRRLGAPAARNLGASEATADAVVFADAHVEPPLGWHDAFSSVLERPKVGAVGPAVVAIGNGDMRGYGMTLKDALMNVTWLARQETEPYPVPMLGGFFVAMRGDVFRDCWGFDGGLIAWGGADSELSLRLWTLGYECILVPGIAVGHLFRRRLPYSLPRYAYAHNLLRIASVHFGRHRLARVVEQLRTWPGFPAALARFVESDALRRRDEFRSRRRHDDEWFCERFGIEVFDRAPKEER